MSLLQSLVLTEWDDVLNGDVLIELTLVLWVLKAKGGIDKVVLVELADGGIAKKGADVAVLVFAANLLQYDLAFVELWAILFGYAKWLELLDYFEELFHDVVYYEIKKEEKARARKRLRKKKPVSRI